MNGMEWYRKQMPFSYPDQLTGEKSPAYYRAELAPERIHLMNDSIKVRDLYILRPFVH